MSSDNFDNIEDIDQTDSMEPISVDYSEVTIQDEIIQMLEFFSLHTYMATNKDPLTSIILNRCVELFERDYELLSIDNSNGQLSTHYPNNILIPKKEKVKNIYHKNYVDFSNIEESVYRSRLARSRTRFPVPVILINGKFIVRSSTVSGLVELIPRSGLEMIQNNPHASSSEEEMKGADADYLKLLGVETIVDLMVEKQKTKYMIPLTSSEKIETDKIYSSFKICSFPYPGCEFFKLFYEENFEAAGLKFDWSQSEIDATLTLPDNLPVDYLNVKWNEYKEWDLIQITQNYLKFILNRIKDDRDSILVHCISGWDRTPLFISLIRLSLWADDLIHRDLNEHEILYFTLAYDWFLFGHNLPQRLQKKESILHFCFSFLKYIKTDEFKLKLRSSSTTKNTSPDVSQLNECEEDMMFSMDSVDSPERASSSGVPPTDHNETNELYSMVMNTNKKARVETSPNDSRSTLSDSFSFINTAGSHRSSSDDSIEKTIRETNRFGAKSHRSTRKNRLAAVRYIFFKCFYKRQIDNDPLFNNNQPSRSFANVVKATTNFVFGADS